MEHWEHLRIAVRDVVGGKEYVLSPRQPDLHANLDNVGPDHTVALLDELGKAEWELVSTDEGAQVFWMKRPANPEVSRLRW